MPRKTAREFAVDVIRTLRGAGFEAYLAGGCVRDELLGLPPKDYDVATSARPEQVRGLFMRTVAVGAAFGVIEVLGPRPIRVEVASFRTDGVYSDGRRPDSIVYSSAEEDAKRRDFTINGMFFDPVENRVIDYVGGQSDLGARVLRAIGDPHARFHEDRLRILRAVRIAARFGLTIDPATEAAVRRMGPQLARGVSAERIADELRKMLVDRHRAAAMRLLMDLGLAAVVMPELVPMCGLPQGLPRPDGPPLPPPGRPGPPVTATGATMRDLWEHVLAALGHLEEPSFPLAMATLLHDVGKPRTVGRTPDRYTFHGHEHVGARMAGDICRRLKLSTDDRERIEWLVEKHQILADVARMRPAKLKRLFVHRGIDELFDLHRRRAGQRPATRPRRTRRPPAARVDGGRHPVPASAEHRRRPAGPRPGAGTRVSYPAR
ncbi:MAG: CCA tRNA nucleotidyltransferase [Gemmataceae bacterium]